MTAPLAGEAARRVVRMEWLTFALVRAASLVNACGALLLAPRVIGAAGLWLGAAVLAESALFVWRTTPARTPRQRDVVVWCDFAFVCVAVLANAALQDGRLLSTWGYFMYPFSLAACVQYGAAARRSWLAAAAGCVLAGMYVLGFVMHDLGPAWNLLPNCLTYPAIALVTCLVSNELRRSATRLDDSRADAERIAGELGEERKRAYYERLLHDRVLQCMELLAGRDLGLPDAISTQIRQEAAWLRTLVATGAPPRVGDLLSELHAQAARLAGSGLRVRVLEMSDQLPTARLAEPTRDALVDAVGEALTNVVKHAGVPDATVELCGDADGVRVVVSDAGEGFDTAAVRTGLGLRRSIEQRIAEVGGTVRVDSAPGAGTSVELWVPGQQSTDQRPRARRARSDTSRDTAGSAAACPRSAAARSRPAGGR
jgi:signal transduction histidine kinase